MDILLVFLLSSTDSLLFHFVQFHMKSYEILTYISYSNNVNKIQIIYYKMHNKMIQYLTGEYSLLPNPHQASIS